jgi:hypothetical protein
VRFLRHLTADYGGQLVEDLLVDNINQEGFDKSDYTDIKNEFTLQFFVI